MTISEPKFYAGGALVIGIALAAGTLLNRICDAAAEKVMIPAAQNQYFFDPKLRHMENLDIPYTVRLLPSNDHALLVSMQARSKGDGSFDLIGQSRDELGLPHTTEIGNFRPKYVPVLQTVQDPPNGAK